MAKTTTLPIPQTLKTAPVTLVNADGTGWKTLYTAGAEGAVVRVFGATCDDTVAANLRIGVDPGTGTVYQKGCVNIPIGAGTTGSVPTVDCLASVIMPQQGMDQTFKRTLQLGAGEVLKIAVLAAVGAGKVLTAMIELEEF